MVALSRCLGSLALLAGTASSARISKSRIETDTKFIAGVPVLNYDQAYAGESLGEAGAEEEWVVMVKQGVTDTDIKHMCGIAANGCKLSGHPDEGGVPFFVMRGSEKDLEAVIKSSSGAVKYIEPDSLVYAIPELKADDESTLWGLNRVGAYKRGNEGAGVAIFLTDTGVRPTHTEFGGRVVPTLDLTKGGVKECNGDATCAGDMQGHGTHCAGTSAGENYGVAPAALIRSVKVLSDQGSGSWSWSYSALDWMASSSIRPAIASMSLGGRGTQTAMRDAVDRATTAGVTVIVAGGNSNSDACNFSPAFVPSAVTVGSTDSRDRRSSFSNYGSCTNIWAPGSAILSAGHRSDSGTATFSGTSMACPHVAGGAALILEIEPSLNRDAVLERLLANGRLDSITDLKTGDINNCLYVGGDAPPPAGGVTPTPPPTPAPTPVPPPSPPSICPSDTTSGPDRDDDCRCKSGLSCYNNGSSGCPVQWSPRLSTRYYHAPTCTTCRCY